MLYCSARFLGEDPYWLCNGPAAPPCPQPWRVRCFKYAMGEIAREEYLRVHNAHPDQHGQGDDTDGATMKMPGGREGVKPRGNPAA